MSFEPKFTVLCYSEPQTIYTDLHNQGHVDKLIKGYPKYEELSRILKPHKKEGSILIVDDGLNAITPDLTKLFFQLSHHANTTVIFVSQNLFYGTKEYRTISLNTQYLFLMKSPRSLHQISHLARQIQPFKSHYIIQAFQQATRLPYSCKCKNSLSLHCFGLAIPAKSCIVL